MRDSQQIQAPKFTNAEIIKRAEELTKRWARHVGPDIGLVLTSFDAIYNEIIYPEYEIKLKENCDLGFDEEGVKILGEYDWMENVAYIDQAINEETSDPRRAFTLWHEVGGHGVLQGDWLRKEQSRVSGNHRLVTTELSIKNQTIDVLERQANLFAANAGVPLWLLEYRMRQVYRPTRPFRFIGPSRYCLDVNGRCRYGDVSTFDDLCRFIAYYVKSSFGGMSSESIGYQVAKTYLVRDVSTRTRPNSRLRRTQKKRQPQVISAFSDVSQVLSGSF